MPCMGGAASERRTQTVPIVISGNVVNVLEVFKNGENEDLIIDRRVHLISVVCSQVTLMNESDIFQLFSVLFFKIYPDRRLCVVAPVVSA